jgi:hypothetical protein
MSLPQIFFVGGGGAVEPNPQITEANRYWPIVPAPDDECGAVSGMLGKEHQSTRGKPAPVPICLPQIPHDLTRASAVGRLQLLAFKFPY